MTCMPWDVKVLSGLTKVSQEEVNANETLLHKSIQLVPVLLSPVGGVGAVRPEPSL